MIVYHGSIKKFDQFHQEMIDQNLHNDINTIGFWFTADIQSSKPYAIGTETVIEKSTTEFWEDGEPKILQYDRPVNGFIYKVYIDDPNLKNYESDAEDSFELFMKERDPFCDYLGGRKRTWKDGAVLLNKEEANAEFRKSLIKQGYEGFLIKNTMLPAGVTDLYCIFSEKALYIADVLPIEELN